MTRQLEALDIIGFKVEGVTHHMVVYRIDGEEMCTLAYASCKDTGRGSLVMCAHEVLAKHNLFIDGKPYLDASPEYKAFENYLVVIHFGNMQRRANRAGQDYPMEFGL